MKSKDQATAQAQEFVRERVDLIVAFEDTSIAAAQNATADPANRIPVVFLHPSDPVRDGLVDSLAHPGGNLTGAFGARDPVVKQLEIYRQILPKPQPLRLLTLVDPTDDVATPPLLDKARDAATKLGIELVEREASDATGLEAAFQSVGPGSVDGAFILSPSLRLDFSAKILALAAASNLPVQAHRRQWVDPGQNDHGALFSLGVDLGPDRRPHRRRRPWLAPSFRTWRCRLGDVITQADVQTALARSPRRDASTVVLAGNQAKRTRAAAANMAWGRSTVSSRHPR